MRTSIIPTQLNSLRAIARDEHQVEGKWGQRANLSRLGVTSVKPTTGADERKGAKRASQRVLDDVRSKF